MRHRYAVTALGLVLLASLTACSTDDSSNPAKKLGANSGIGLGCGDTCQVFEAVRAFSHAYFEGHSSEAYGLLSARCQERLSPGEFGKVDARLARSHPDVHIIKKSVEIDERSQVVALATYSYGVPALAKQDERWVKEHGGWRNDDC